MDGANHAMSGHSTFPFDIFSDDWKQGFSSADVNAEGRGDTVIGPDGEWLGTVETPPRFRILDVAGGLVLGVELDEMDVENVVVYELIGG